MAWGEQRFLNSRDSCIASQSSWMLDSESHAESSAINAVTGELVALSSAVVVEVETDGAGFVLLLRMLVNFPLLLLLVFGIAMKYTESVI